MMAIHDGVERLVDAHAHAAAAKVTTTPRQDRLGTVRRDGTDLFVKVGGDVWIYAGSTRNDPMTAELYRRLPILDNEAVAPFPTAGVVSGTPASKAGGIS